MWELWYCDGNTSISLIGILWAIAKGQQMSYEQEDVVDVVCPRHDLMKKTTIPSVENQAQHSTTCEHTFWESMITQRSRVTPLLSTH